MGITGLILHNYLYSSTNIKISPVNNLLYNSFVNIFMVGQTQKPKLDRCRESPTQDNQASQLNKELNYHN